jgi:hypothetical protein
MSVMPRVLLAGAALLLAACGGGGAGAGDGPAASDGGLASDGPGATDRPPPADGPPPGDGPGPDGAADGAPADAGPDGPPPGLPFAYTRPAAGTPLTPQELAAITDVYVDLLRQTRYFDFLDERVVGWPESDPQQRYWYGHWWTGAGLEKSGGQVSLVHVDCGADNAGIPSSFVLEGVCLAHLQWPNAKLEHIVRKLVRAFNAWALAMKRSAGDPEGVLLARVSYPESITSTDSGRTLAINYAADRPGVDSYTLYVHLPTNPTWGDIYVKNKRSKDDIGHMLRALGTLEDCAPGFAAATRADIAEAKATYAAWARRVEDDGWAIATLDQSLNLEMPPLDSTMSRYISAGNAECNAMTALRLLGRGDPGGFVCNNGVHALEGLVLSNPSNGEIIRSYHEAAVRNALLGGANTIAHDLLTGLAWRADQGMGFAESGSWPVHINAELLVKLLVNAANTGLPLTAREVRWVHARIQEAHDAYVTNTDPAQYRVFDPATPDGAYGLGPDTAGIDLRFLAALVGTCTARYRNPAGVPLLDCSRLASLTP